MAGSLGVEVMFGSIVVKVVLPTKVAGTVVGVVAEVVVGTFFKVDMPMVPDPFVGITLDVAV